MLSSRRTYIGFSHTLLWWRKPHPGLVNSRYDTSALQKVMPMLAASPSCILSSFSPKSGSIECYVATPSAVRNSIICNSKLSAQLHQLYTCNIATVVYSISEVIVTTEEKQINNKFMLIIGGITPAATVESRQLNPNKIDEISYSAVI